MTGSPWVWSVKACRFMKWLLARKHQYYQLQRCLLTSVKVVVSTYGDFLNITANQGAIFLKVKGRQTFNQNKLPHCMITIRVNSATILQRLDSTDSEWAQESSIFSIASLKAKKGKPPLEDSNQRPCTPQARDLQLHLANDSSGLIFRLIQRPGKVADWQSSTETQWRPPFRGWE